MGSFSPALRICGALMIMGGLFFATEPIARRMENKKSEKNLTVNGSPEAMEPGLPQLTADRDRETNI